MGVPVDFVRDKAAHGFDPGNKAPPADLVNCQNIAPSPLVKGVKLFRLEFYKSVFSERHGLVFYKVQNFPGRSNSL